MELPKKNVTHVCLIGDDPTANVTPLIDRDIPCERIIFVYFIEQKEQFESLKNVAKRRGAKVDSWIVPSSQGTKIIDTESLKLSFMTLFERELKDAKKQKQLWLNSSNGTRQQILSAYEVARSFQCPIFLVEPQSDSLCWLYPEEWPLTPIKDKLKLHEFFEVNGCQLTSQKNKKGIEKKLRELGERWLDKSSQLHSGLAKLNYLASTARGETLLARQNKSMLNDKALQWLLDDLNQINLVSIEGSQISFRDQDVRFFCNGGWLEETVFGMLRGLRSEIKTIQDDGHSMEIEREFQSHKVSNELDVVALVNNKLHIIECKTKKFDGGHGSDTLYKLDSIASVLGGIKASAALVTFFPITKAEHRRARELGIEIFGPAKLARLNECLKKWLMA